MPGTPSKTLASRASQASKPPTTPEEPGAAPTTVSVSEPRKCASSSSSSSGASSGSLKGFTDEEVSSFGGMLCPGTPREEVPALPPPEEPLTTSVSPNIGFTDEEVSMLRWHASVEHHGRRCRLCPGTPREEVPAAPAPPAEDLWPRYGGMLWPGTPQEEVPAPAPPEEDLQPEGGAGPVVGDCGPKSSASGHTAFGLKIDLRALQLFGPPTMPAQAGLAPPHDEAVMTMPPSEDLGSPLVRSEVTLALMVAAAAEAEAEVAAEVKAVKAVVREAMQAMAARVGDEAAAVAAETEAATAAEAEAGTAAELPAGLAPRAVLLQAQGFGQHGAVSISPEQQRTTMSGARQGLYRWPAIHSLTPPGQSSRGWAHLYRCHSGPALGLLWRG